MEKKKWNAKEYQDSFRFVSNYGKGVLDLLDVEPNMRILDVGCGNGLLTKELCLKGAVVTGVDASEDMLLLAKENAPQAKFMEKDASRLDFYEEFDAVFSNAVFHWIWDQDGLLEGVARALKPGGQLVCEFGGKGCGETVHRTLKELFEERGKVYRNPFYFPSLGEYTPLIEAHGLLVEYGALFPRITPLSQGNTASDWIRMFVTEPFAKLSSQETEEIIQEADKRLEPVLKQGDTWIIDYVRIRLKARKIQGFF